MIVKIGNKFTDSKDEPIMLILSNEEKVSIASMGEQSKFCAYSLKEVDSINKMRSFMNDEEELKKKFFMDIAPDKNSIEYSLTMALLVDSSGRYKKWIKDLVEFFKDNDQLITAEAIYTRYGLSGLKNFKESLK